MKTLMEKVERMIATILEALDMEQGSSDVVSLSQDDRYIRSGELKTEAHHTLIEPCW
jgi:hypothetical protein